MRHLVMSIVIASLVVGCSDSQNLNFDVGNGAETTAGDGTIGGETLDGEDSPKTCKPVGPMESRLVETWPAGHKIRVLEVGQVWDAMTAVAVTVDSDGELPEEAVVFVIDSTGKVAQRVSFAVPSKLVSSDVIRLQSAMLYDKGELFLAIGATEDRGYIATITKATTTTTMVEYTPTIEDAFDAGLGVNNVRGLGLYRLNGRLMVTGHGVPWSGSKVHVYDVVDRSVVSTPQSLTAKSSDLLRYTHGDTTWRFWFDYNGVGTELHARSEAGTEILTLGSWDDILNPEYEVLESEGRLFAVVQPAPYNSASTTEVHEVIFGSDGVPQTMLVSERPDVRFLSDITLMSAPDGNDTYVAELTDETGQRKGRWTLHSASDAGFQELLVEDGGLGTQWVSTPNDYRSAHVLLKLDRDGGVVPELMFEMLGCAAVVD